MISFHKAEAADRAWAHEILKRCAYPGAEYAFSCKIGCISGQIISASLDGRGSA